MDDKNEDSPVYPVTCSPPLHDRANKNIKAPDFFVLPAWRHCMQLSARISPHPSGLEHHIAIER